MLLVGTDPFNLKAIQLMLKITGFQNDTAKNGKEAIEKALQKFQHNTCKLCDGYCLVIMNFEMREKNGYECSFEMLKLSR